MIPLLQGLLKAQAETLEQRVMRLQRAMRQSRECWTCGESKPMNYTNEFFRWDGFEQVIALVCDECKRKRWDELDGIWR